MKEYKFRIAHFPQVPCKPFYVPVRDLKEAQKVSDILADYDAFQFNHRIKPDYSNMTILEVFDEDTNGWLSWEDEATGISDIDEYFEHLEGEE